MKLQNLARIGALLFGGTVLCRAEDKILQDLNSPNGSSSLKATVSDVSNPENPTFVCLKQGPKTLWSKTFVARYVRFSWSPNSRYALIEVDHQKESLLSEKLYLLDLEHTSKLDELPLGALIHKISESLPDEGPIVFGYRSGMSKPVWTNSHSCKIVYDIGAGTCRALVVLILDASSNRPSLAVKSVSIAKTEKELDDVLNRIGAGENWD